ncbi:hypothetical protein [Pedobacter cryophilus]|uniref:Uncharacterized protein n=1 Tax=Pedobacter cryophilus TaxID=2571271 RepID=A0A4U1BV66_9SPHI|nr:hypothetical protein [Pedobacter cryophilus]TKB96001.1 hypothetical protein FA046_15125 [Pedobacter cryophilus]
MSNRFKKIFLGVSISLPFLLYCIYYYTIMVKNAPYKFAEFENITLKESVGKNFNKLYSSKSQEFQFLNTRDSLVKNKVKLSKDDLLFLHRKAAELGFWNWPTKMIGDTSGKSPRYYLQFDYQRKSKIIEIDAAYDQNIKLRDAAIELAKTVDKAILDADDAQN